MGKRKQATLQQNDSIVVSTPYGDIEILVDAQATVIELSTNNARGSTAQLVEFTRYRFRVHVYGAKTERRVSQPDDHIE